MAIPKQIEQDKLTDALDIELSKLEWKHVEPIGQMVVVHKDRLYCASVYEPNETSRNFAYFTLLDYADITDIEDDGYQEYYDHINKVLGTNYAVKVDASAYIKKLEKDVDNFLKVTKDCTDAKGLCDIVNTSGKRMQYKEIENILHGFFHQVECYHE